MKNRGFVDLHCHTIFSDGGMLPAGLMQRAIVRGCMGLAITDHVDSSNYEFVLSRILQFVQELGDQWHLGTIPGPEATSAPTSKLSPDEVGDDWHMPVFAGLELTSVPPQKIAPMAERARALGAEWIVVHGETLMEPVAPGTNRAAIEAQVDLLAHPGIITKEDASRAAQLGVYLEITTHRGHCLGNGCVAQRAREVGAKLLVNTDCHISADILDTNQRRAIALGAGLTSEEVDQIWENGRRAVEELLKNRSSR